VTRPHFQNQMGRLSERWRGVYVPSLVEIIWREASQLSNEWFTRTVDDLIGCCRQAPLMPELRERISIERERLWQQEKKQNAKDARDFWAGTLMPEESRIICQAITARIERRLSDEHWESFMRGLEGMSS
jgi:hypothetical protein